MNFKKAIGFVVSAAMCFSMCVSNVTAVDNNPEDSFEIVAINEDTGEITPLYTTSKSAKSDTNMKISLAAGKSGNSNKVSFKMTGIPTDKQITKIGISAKPSTSSATGGLILVTEVNLYSPDGHTYSNPWGIGNVIEITDFFINDTFNGTWYMDCYGTNISNKAGDITYSNCTLAIYYRI